MSERLLPPGWARPRGYSAGISTSGSIVFVSGQIGWDTSGAFPSRDLAGQVRQALRNVLDVLAEAGAGPEHVARMTWYLVDKADYLRQQSAIGAAYRETMGAHYPAMSVVEVAGLLETQAKVEIEVTAVIPASGDARL